VGAGGRRGEWGGSGEKKGRGGGKEGEQVSGGDEGLGGGRSGESKGLAKSELKK